VTFSSASLGAFLFLGAAGLPAEGKEEFFLYAVPAPEKAAARPAAAIVLFRRWLLGSTGAVHMPF